MTEEYIIKQLSIFCENKTGKLAAIAKVFLDIGVSVQAFNIAEANNFGVVRVIVDKPETAFAEFAKQNYALQYTDVLAIKMENVPGGLFHVVKLLGDSGINIDYAYTLGNTDFGALIIKIANPREAVPQIKKLGLELIPAKDYTI
jgi:ACT domain-containing protein